LKERSGVVNLYLAVEMSDHKNMVMLYKLTNGFVQEEHYGLACARAIELPPRVLEVAEKVSLALEAQASAKRRSSEISALAKKRKLVLNLHATLKQVRDGPMEGKALLDWLRKLQEEFVIRMEQIERDAMRIDESPRIITEKSSEKLEDMTNLTGES
jgi:DNA mismatch repair protein MSH4